MKKQIFCWVLSCLVVLTSCQKELSFEQGNKPGHGTLQEESSGDCLPKTVNGIYEATVPLVPASNNITVDIDVSETGTYTITTDTVNGIYFRATGVFTTTGMNTITLRGNGTPFTSGVHNFVVSYDGASCDIQVTTLPSGAGGPAVFTLETTGTSPVNCSGATAAGNYIINTPLGSTNTVTLSVNVTTIGTYTISSTLTNGMTFSKTDVFLNTGVQTVTLVGSGTPTGTPGPVTIPVTVGTTTCNFQVTTQAGAEFSFDCSSAQVNGTYTENVALSGATVDINVNATTAGPYNINVTTSGMTFTASGNFIVGSNPITLNVTGTPTADGTIPVNMPGTTPCSFDVIVTAAPSIDWEFSDGTVTYKGSTLVAMLTPAGPVLNFAYTGDDPGNNQIGFNLNDMSAAINNGETYSTVITPNNSAVFFFQTAGGDTYTTDATRNVTFTVVTHDVPNKKITGTFAGNAKNTAGATKPITGGKFTGAY